MTCTLNRICIMFSSKAKLENVAFGRQGRFEYLQTLVTEFQDTHKQGADM